MSPSSSSSSSSSYFYSSSVFSNGSNTSGHRYATVSNTDPEGITTIRTANQDLGQPIEIQQQQYDRTGHNIGSLPAGSLAGGVRTITEEDDEDEQSQYRSSGRSQGQVPRQPNQTESQDYSQSEAQGFGQGHGRDDEFDTHRFRPARFKQESEEDGNEDEPWMVFEHGDTSERAAAYVE